MSAEIIIPIPNVTYLTATAGPPSPIGSTWPDVAVRASLSLVSSCPCPYCTAHFCTTHPIKAEHLTQKLLTMIAEATAEMERVSEQRALDMQSDLVDEIEQVCKMHVEKVQ